MILNFKCLARYFMLKNHNSPLAILFNLHRFLIKSHPIFIGSHGYEALKAYLGDPLVQSIQ